MIAERFFVIDGDIKGRASLCHTLSEIGFALPFGRVEDIGPVWPEVGWLLVRDDGDNVRRTLDRLDALDLYYPLIAYSSAAPTLQVVGTLLAGAIGYVDWPAPADDLVGQINHLRRSAAGRIGRAAAGVEARRLLRHLSPRELAVVEALSEGRTNREIASDLGISPRTVEVHRANALEKLHATSSIDAAKLVYRASDLRKPGNDHGCMFEAAAQPAALMRKAG